MKKGLIYTAVSPSGKVYVGKTLQPLAKRIARHYNKASEKNINGKFILETKFANALRKYGEQLVWDVLEEDVPENNLSVKEKEYVEKYDSYNAGYNSTLGGDGGDTYSLLSEAAKSHVKKKISERLKKTFASNFYRGEMPKRVSGKNNPMYGKQSAMKGKTHTKEARKKISAAVSRSNRIRGLLNDTYPKVIEKPWGRENVLEFNKHYCLKRIEINKGHQTSLQYHNLKKETIFLEKGEAVFCYEDQDGFNQIEVEKGFCVTLEPGEVHRFIALTDITLLEASTPELWDVVRLEDGYGRK